MFTAVSSSLPQCSILQLGLVAFPNSSSTPKRTDRGAKNAKIIYLNSCPFGSIHTGQLVNLYFFTFFFVLSRDTPSTLKGRESRRCRSILFSVTMDDPNRPSPFSYPSYSSSDTRETETPSHDWSASRFSQPSVGFPVGIEGLPGSSENPAGAFRTTTGDRSMNAKVPIPRTATPSTWTSSGRVSRACENCREQKAKCSGHRPTCQRCQEAGVSCSYGDRKREKMTKCVEWMFYRVTCLHF